MGKKNKKSVSLKAEDIILEQKQRIKILEEENAYLKHQIKELQDKVFKKKKKKDDIDSRDPKKPKPKKKRGAPLGHLGWFRKKPDKIDRVEEVTLEKCPECGSEDLEVYDEVEEHVQEDIILPRVEATCYRKYLYHCKCCQQEVEGRGQNELPNSYIGPIAKTVAIYLKYHIKVSDRDIQKIFKQLFNLTVTPSAIPGFRNQLRRYCESTYEKLLEELKKSDFIHADETGWRLDGILQWLWNFSTDKVSISQISEGRGQKDLHAVLGEKFDGVLISDFLSAYNKIEAKAKQRCLVHLLRDLKKVQECLGDDAAVMNYCNRLKQIIERAVMLAKTFKAGKCSVEVFEKIKQSLKTALSDLDFADPSHRILQRFVKRLRRHKNEIFTFLDYPNVEYHNNRAERQIRPHVILRKIVFGNRSLEGIKNHEVLMSVIQTAHLRNLDPLKVLRNLCLNFDQPNFQAFAPP